MNFHEFLHAEIANLRRNAEHFDDLADAAIKLGLIPIAKNFTYARLIMAASASELEAAWRNHIHEEFDQSMGQIHKTLSELSTGGNP